MACDSATGSLLLAYRGHEGCVGLQFAVDLQLGVELVCQLCGLYHFVYHLVLGAAFGREAQHCDARLGDTSYRLCGAGGAYSDL